MACKTGGGGSTGGSHSSKSSKHPSHKAHTKHSKHSKTKGRTKAHKHKAAAVTHASSCGGKGAASGGTL